MVSHLLNVKNLKVSFQNAGGDVQAVRDVSFHVDEGEILAVVGESGCGKSVTAHAIMGMIPSYGKINNGHIFFQEKDITLCSKKELRSIRGSEIGMIFQDPMSALNPTMKIGKQIDEVLLKKQRLSKREAKKKSIELLKLVGISDAETRYSEYPHEFSGGMRQRVVIAIALACEPKLIIADEPTTALDVTIQAQILELLIKLQKERSSSTILITHDLGVVAEVADRVAVMYAGMIIETGTVQEIFEQPKHPYTWGLMRSVPKPNTLEKERLIPIEGTPPDLADPPTGCPFAARCPYTMEICTGYMPELESFSNLHQARCWLNDPRASKNRELIAVGR
ncbi:ABC transporter ATP-binding protein [Bacillus sp. CGMCC 1.16607]|uniref:ABC transporter ATP-binding protein n=1 Tax=Bacillus sp. CGMCC 1.16607 TaxID=3351842 RepID=UPI00362FCEC2